LQVSTSEVEDFSTEPVISSAKFEFIFFVLYFVFAEGRIAFGHVGYVWAAECI